MIAGVFVYFSYWPKFDRIQLLQTNLQQLESKLKVAKRNAAALNRFQAEMRQAEAQFKLAMQRLPEKQEIPSLLVSISKSGKAVGLDFLLFEPKPEKRKQFYAEIPVAMSIQGDYHNIAIFFDQVARLSRIVNIRNIQLQPAKSRDGSSRILKARCTAITYKFIDEPPQKKSKTETKRKRRK